jgi:adenylate cyclase
MTLTRRLAAILAADVAGYRRLIGADEEGTRARRRHRRELVDPKITEYRGRIVKTTGDALLVEFASVVDALCCATEMHGTRSPRILPSDMTITWSAAAAKSRSWVTTTTPRP